MRRQFPLFWIPQFLALLLVGSLSLFAPQATLKWLRGEHPPQVVAKPQEALGNWILRIESIPPPPDLVREFFRNHRNAEQAQFEHWRPGDPSENQTVEADSVSDWDSPEVRDAAWNAFESWLLSCTPPPSTKNLTAIRTWMKSIDQTTVPTPELVDWVVNQKVPAAPPPALRRMILESEQTLPARWKLAADQQRQAGNCIMAAVLFTLLGMISPAIRRPLARIFVLIALFWMLAMLKSSLGPETWDFQQGIMTMGLVFGLVMAATAVRKVPGLTGRWTLWLILTGWAISMAVLAAIDRDQSASLARQTSTAVCTLAMALMMIANGWYWLIGESEDPPQDDAGVAQSRPPQLWTLWLVQFVVFAAVGGASLWIPHQVMEFFTSQSADYLVTDVGHDATRILGAWLIALALFSFFALGAAQDWLWQIVAWIFVSVFAVMGIFSLWNTAMSSEYAVWQLLYTLAALVFGLGNLRLIEKTDKSSSAETVENTREGWTTELLPGLKFARAALSGKRPLFRHGVVLTGRFHSAPEEGVPGHEFFASDRPMSVIARFSNRTQDDDASLDIRGCALRITPDAGRDAVPLDLLMATGTYAPARSCRDVENLAPGCDLQRDVMQDRILREGMAAGMRRSPESFACLSFYQQIVLEWLEPSAAHRLVRFRLVPETKSSPESEGVPDETDLQSLWQQARRDQESRQTDYLRQELVYRVARCQKNRAAGEEPNRNDIVRFNLQAQLHKPQANDSLDWYDASLEWDTRSHPWRTLGVLELMEPVSPDHADAVLFDPFHMPRSIRLPRPASQTALDDPRMLARLQFRIVSVLGRIRTRGLLAMARNYE